MLKSISKMINLFEQNNIIYCHWKSNEHLEPALEGDTDLDMLFLPEQKTKLEQLLNECGLKRFRAMPLGQYNAIEDFIGYDIEEAKIWHLHLHYRLTIGEKNLKGYTLTPWGNRVIENRIYSSLGCYSSSYEDELLLLFVRMALKLRIFDCIGNVGNDDIREMEWLIRRYDKEKFQEEANILLGSQFLSLLTALVETPPKNKRELFKLAFMLRKKFKLFTFYSSIWASFLSYVRSIYGIFGGINRRMNMNVSKPTRRVSPSGGCVVAFLGSDGAGKTTTINYVKKEFSKKIDVKTVYLGSGDGDCSLLRLPMRFIARKIGGKGVGASIEKEYIEKKDFKKKISLKARVYSIAKVIWAVTLANEKQRKLRSITKARNRGMLVLIDRYPQTEFTGYGDGPLLTKYLDRKRGFLYKQAQKEVEIYESAIINPPDIFIKLIVPTEVAINRKPEMSVDEIEEKKSAVLSIFKGYKSCIIDSSVDKKTSFGRIMNEIWKIV